MPPPAPAAGTPAPQAGQPAAAAPQEPEPARASTGLVPLPTPRQVIAALPLGRRDPFASPFPPLPPLAAPTAPGAAAPPGTSGAATAARPGATGSTPGRGGAAAPPPRPQPPAPLTPPAGFRVTGLIRTGGTSEAVVEYGSLSGSLRAGDRGGRTTDLLPGGWSVAAVDVNRGRITLQRGMQRVTAEL